MRKINEWELYFFSKEIYDILICDPSTVSLIHTKSPTCRTICKATAIEIEERIFTEETFRFIFSITLYTSSFTSKTFHGIWVFISAIRALFSTGESIFIYQPISTITRCTNRSTLSTSCAWRFTLLTNIAISYIAFRATI